MLKIQFVGTGAFFADNNFNANLILERNGKRLLLDAGMDIKFSFKNAGLKPKDIDAVYISHLHADHAGGVEWLAFGTYFDPNKEKIQLFGNNKVLREGWDHTWKGGLRSIHNKVMTLQDYFDVNMIRDNGSFIWEDVEFNLVQTLHITNGYEFVPSYGVIMKDPDTGKKLFYTADTQYSPSQMLITYNAVDHIIQDCETSPYKSGVHAHFDDLCNLPPEVKAKMTLIHCQANAYYDNMVDDEYTFGSMGICNNEWEVKADEAGFAGIADVGDVIEYN